MVCASPSATPPNQPGGPLGRQAYQVQCFLIPSLRLALNRPPGTPLGRLRPVSRAMRTLRFATSACLAGSTGAQSAPSNAQNGHLPPPLGAYARVPWSALHPGREYTVPSAHRKTGHRSGTLQVRPARPSCPLSDWLGYRAKKAPSVDRRECVLSQEARDS
jgi:hypothetical protein